MGGRSQGVGVRPELQGRAGQGREAQQDHGGISALGIYFGKGAVSGQGIDTECRKGQFLI